MTGKPKRAMTYGDVGHLWRDGRWHAALDTQYFVMDERGLADMVRYAVGVARLLTYFTSENKAVASTDGKGWDAFFGGDITFLLAQMASYQAPKIDPTAPVADLESCLESEIEALMLNYARAEQVAEIDAPDQLEDGIFGTMKTAVSAELAGVLPDTDGGPQAQPMQRLTNAKASTSPTEDILKVVIRLNEQLAKVASRSLSSSLNEQSNHPAHAGLFLSFLSLLQDSKTQLNELTERHLVFYYERMLMLRAKPAQPDRTWLSFQLSPKDERLDLPAGSHFLAATQSDGTTPTFATDGDFVLTQARLDRMQAVQMVTGSHHEIGGIHAYPAPLSRDGLGAPLAEPALGAPVFGPTSLDRNAARAATMAAAAGVIFTSGELGLSEGHRRIRLSLTLRATAQTHLSKAITQYRRLLARGHEGTIDDAEFATMLTDCFLLTCSGKKGPQTITSFVVDTSAAASNRLNFDITLPQDFPAIEPDPKSQVSLPSLTLMLNPAARAFGYQPFGALQIVGTELEVSAQGLRKLKIGAGAGKPISTKPISPFGANPKVGDDIVFSHPDLAGKAVSDLNLSFDWLGLPQAPETLAAYYSSYELETQNSSFRASFQVAGPDGWSAVLPSGAPKNDLDHGVPLFTSTTDADTLAPCQKWSFDLSELDLAAVPQLQMTFAAPGYGFGAQIFPDVVAATVLENARAKTSIVGKITGKPPPLKPMPNPPLQPKLANLQLGFKARASTQAGDLVTYAFKPFAAPQIAARPTLAPLDFFGRSALYFGFTQLEAGETITALFEMVDSAVGQAAASTTDADAPLEWAYLGARGWAALPRQNVSLDETENLTRTGVIALAIPFDAAPDDDGITWLAVTAKAGIRPLGQIVSVTPQATSVTRVLSNTEAAGALPPLAAGKITKPALPTPALTKVIQPLPTFGGAAAEGTRDFRIRVSERLRHKGRAIYARDYEELTLDAFPDIFEAKCTKAADGALTLVVTPTEGRTGIGTRPIVSRSRRVAIATYLEGLSANWGAQINVINPRYEPIQLRAWVAPHSPVEVNSFIHALETAFIHHITPWRADPSHPMAIGAGQLDLAGLAATLKSVANVDVVTGMSLTQFFLRGGSGRNTTHHGLKDTARLEAHEANTSVVLRPSSPYSVLVPATQQDLHILPPTRSIGDLAVNRDLYAASDQQHDLWSVDSNLIPARPQPVGIGDLSVGHTMIVTTPRDARPWIQPAFASPPPSVAPLMAMLPPLPVAEAAKGLRS